MEEERWEDYEDINVSLTESLGDYKPSSPSDVESLEFKFPTKGDANYIAEEEDFGPETDPPGYTEVSRMNEIPLFQCFSSPPIPTQLFRVS